MNKLILFGVFFCFSTALSAACPEGDKLYSKSAKASVPAYQLCAVQDNDEFSQVRLADLFKKGSKNVEKNETKALLFYHLAANNGNAYAQTELAKLILMMDEDEEKRKKLASYMKQIKSASQNADEFEFKGELLHPYVWLLLASEDASQKWYYPSTKKYSSEAAALIKNYQLPDEKKRELIFIASQWKQQKMMQTAKEVLAESEYKTFKDTLFPKQGKADSFLRKQALTNLKDKVENYLK